MKNEISVVIPTLNSANYLTACFQSLKDADFNGEVIIADGGSNDQTLDIAKSFNLKVVSSQKGRGYQLNAGAKAAKGDILFFLHADSTVPNNIFEMIQAFYKDTSVNVSKCMMCFDHTHWLLKIYSFMTPFDSLWTSFGDQGIIVRRNFYEEIGGFAQWPLLEGVHFFQRARVLTKVHTLPVSIKTSAEKFVTNGILKQQLRNGKIIQQYLKGVSPETLYQEYYT